MRLYGRRAAGLPVVLKRLKWSRISYNIFMKFTTMINEISALFVMIFTSGLMFVMPILYIGYNDILVIIGFGILLSFMLTIIPILLSYDIRDEIIELIEDLDNQIVVDTSVYKTDLP